MLSMLAELRYWAVRDYVRSDTRQLARSVYAVISTGAGGKNQTPWRQKKWQKVQKRIKNRGRFLSSVGDIDRQSEKRKDQGRDLRHDPGPNFGPLLRWDGML